MRPFQILRVDAAELLAKRHANDAGVDERSSLGEQPMLRDHIGGAEQRTGEHQLPVQRDTFALELIDVERLGIVDEPKLALWRKRFDNLQEVRAGLRETRHMRDVGNTDTFQLG